MNIDGYKSRLKTTGVLYVDLFPYFEDGHGNIEYLVLKRKSDVELSDTWQGISGKIGEQETIKETFFSQAKKRTGLMPDFVFKIDRVNTYYDSYYDTVMLVPVAACRLNRKNIELSSLHVDFKWVTEDVVDQFFIWPNQRECVAQIDFMLKNRNLISSFHKLTLD